MTKFPDVGKDDQDLILAGVLSRSGKADEAVQLLLSSNLRYSNQYKPGPGLNRWLQWGSETRILKGQSWSKYLGPDFDWFFSLDCFFKYKQRNYLYVKWSKLNWPFFQGFER